MLEKLFKVNVHLEHMMIVEETNSVEFTVVKPDKLSHLANIKLSPTFLSPTKYSSKVQKIIYSLSRSIISGAIKVSY